MRTHGDSRKRENQCWLGLQKQPSCKESPDHGNGALKHGHTEWIAPELILAAERAPTYQLGYRKDQHPAEE
ncbi:hypothetical protein M1K48_00260 [Sphingomonas glaciei]|uniref:Uncharacterized protein n=1 Tax=Sphingomonas glaciei TaxID=2938948 RepID=A0ABY5MVV7_9SPHN|nr:hypothetical protein [Sphingomonas glaciei]UUR08121.1 hypothetical protein M1K48_00260 [Sphingomonas glaciei]